MKIYIGAPKSYLFEYDSAYIIIMLYSYVNRDVNNFAGRHYIPLNACCEQYYAVK